MFSQIGRFKDRIVFGGLALALLAGGAAPLLGGDAVDAAKKNKKAKTPNIAIQAISIEDHPDDGHRYVVVNVANVGKRAANGFRIGLESQRSSGEVRPEELSELLSIPKGGSTEVRFRLGCNWINYSTITASTDPSPVPGEAANKTANNTLSQSYDLSCVIQVPPLV